MDTYRRGSLSLHTLKDLLESPLTTEEMHKRLNDDKDSISSQDTNMDRESNSSPLSTLDEGQEQLVVDHDGNAAETGQTEHSDPDGPPKPPRSYIDEGLPDLLRSGSPLRRRVSSPVSATLKHVKREVALSRQRSLRLKAQVDRLEQQNENGPGWSENRQRVAEEVQSVVKLLLPLTDLEAAEVNQPSQANALDTALLQLKKVARSLALNNNSQGKARSGEDAAILQQALWDRDEAVAKKQAMETELLRSKNELMTLNNHLLEAVQSRLELSIELEAWKDDVQTILHHQLLKQQQEEQAQKKSKGFGVLRRSNKPLPQKPDYSTLAQTPVSTPQSPATTQRWKDKFRRGKITTQGPVESQSQMRDKEDNFQTVSLD
ncbi:bicaudal-D-related protein 2-like [Pimephales promelas]|uniref:bicaudal-D-related protein 2-like n=1 Tax=Pimephales promelas TaxID=90988 RepID=UPI00195559AD|nr:bicaudal-D-related protein 2-like [Pimephales promelas]KAG1940621.1 BICD family-like cargo adapter [Pimephales promelas]